MNNSKKDVRRIIKKALLFSEKPTKRELCTALFIHALVIALIVVGMLSRNPIVEFIGMAGMIWFVRITQQIVIGLTDNSDRYIWQVVNQVYRRAVSAAINDALLELLVGAIALLILFGFSILAVVSGVFWPFYTGIGGAIAVIVAFVGWHIWTIARQVKAQSRQEKIV